MCPDIWKLGRNACAALACLPLVACVTAGGGDSALTRISDEELDKLEIAFTGFRPPPPKKSLADEREIIELIDLSHQSSCDGSPFYDVTTPAPGEISSDNGNWAVHFGWRDAATKAFRYGDMENALRYINGAYRALPTDWTGQRGGIDLARSAYYSILGQSGSAESDFVTGEGKVVSAYRWVEADGRARFDAWRQEASAIIVYGSGRYREAELRLRKLKGRWDTSGWNQYAIASSSAETPPESPVLQYAITGKVFAEYLLTMSLANQGRLVEAESHIRSTIWRIDDPIDLAWIIDAFGTVLMRKGDFDEAEWASRIIAEFFKSNCAPTHYFVVLRSYLMLANALTAQGKWDEALEWYELASQAGSRDQSGVFDRLLGSTPDWAIAQMLAGRHSEATSTLSQVHSRLTQENASRTALLQVEAFQAMNKALEDQDEPSLRLFENSLTGLARSIEGNAGGQEGQAAEQRRFSLLVDTFLRLSIGKLSPRSAFQISQIGQGGSVQSALASSALRAQVGDPTLADLLRKYQDIVTKRRELSRVLAAQASLTNSQNSGISQAELASQIQFLEAARRTALDRIQIQFPEFAQLTANRPLTIEETTALMASNEAAILIRSFGTTTYMLAIGDNGDISLTSAAISEEEIGKQVDHLRLAVDPGPLSSLRDIPVFDVKAAYRLYETLLAPTRSVWEKADSLIIVTEGSLTRLPLSLLVTEAPEAVSNRGGTLPFDRYRSVAWLANTHAVSVLPSLNALSSLRGRPTTEIAGLRPFVGIGDPFFSTTHAREAEREQFDAQQSRGLTLRVAPDLRSVDSATLAVLPRLPDTRPELISVAESLNVRTDQSTYFGVDASEKTVLSLDLSNVQVISFATHGLAAGDLDGLNEPALALSAPSVTGDENTDGLLTLSEILGLKLNADWVVLSACNTAAGDGTGGEAVSGLGRAFFYAGTKSILASHWPVHSRATTDLMQTVFRNYANEVGIDRAEALRRARMHLVQQATFTHDGKELFSYAHPIFWAPFTLIGDGGSRGIPPAT